MALGQSFGDLIQQAGLEVEKEDNNTGKEAGSNESSEKISKMVKNIGSIVEFKESKLFRRLNQEEKRSVVLELIKRGRSLKWFPEYNDDKEIVLAAVNQYYNDLYYASDKLQKDKDIFMESLQTLGPSYLYDGTRIFDYTEFIEHIHNGELIPENLRDDEEVMLQVCRVSSEQDVFKFASDRLKNNRNFMLKALNILSDDIQGGGRYDLDDALKYIPESLWKDHEFIEILANYIDMKNIPKEYKVLSVK